MAPLFRAVAALIEREPAFRNKISIVQWGRMDKESERLVTSLNLTDIVQLGGIEVPGCDSDSGADILYLGIADLGEYTWSRGGFFDYLCPASRLAGSSGNFRAADLIRQAPVATVVKTMILVP